MKPLTPTELRRINEALSQHGREGCPLTHALVLLWGHTRALERQLAAHRAVYRAATEVLQ